MSYLYHCPQNGNSVFCADIVDQTLIQLDAVHRVLLQIREGRKAFPKIVQCNFYSILFQGEHVLPDLRGMFYPGALRQFKDQQLSWELIAVNNFHTSGRKIRRGKSFPGEIAGKEKAVHTLVGQFLKKPTGGPQTVIVQFVDQSLPFQHGHKHMGAQQSLLWVKPSGECLTAHDPVCAGIHIKLDIQLKLAMLQSLIHRQPELLLKPKLFLRLIGKQAEVLPCLAGAAGRLAGIENHFLQIPVSLSKGVNACGNADISRRSICPRIVTLGCVMMRVCNLDTCPVGVATQNPELRKRFRGKPEYVVNFMRFVAQDLREHMAKLGVHTVDELVGRTDLLSVRSPAVNERAATVDLSPILNNPWAGQAKTHFDPVDVYDFKLEDTVDLKELEPRLGTALSEGKPGRLTLQVSSTDRAVGTILGSDVTRLHGKNLPDGTFTVKCTGGGGQSFGAFLPQGVTLELEGDANDYLGKGLSGGTIVVYPPKESPFDPAENILVGNVALYGATSGRAFLGGVAGERFFVRNSGATAVVEGVGDHGCEYMTGGVAVVLGPTGKNFAAGMSGGVAYVLDEKRDLYLRLNKALVSMSTATEPEDVARLRELIQAHAEATGSAKAKNILAHFDDYLPLFKKILPHDYDRMLRTIAAFRAQGMAEDEARVEAFYANTRKINY